MYGRFRLDAQEDQFRSRAKNCQANCNYQCAGVVQKHSRISSPSGHYHLTPSDVSKRSCNSCINSLPFTFSVHTIWSIFVDRSLSIGQVCHELLFNVHGSMYRQKSKSHIALNLIGTTLYALWKIEFAIIYL